MTTHTLTRADLAHIERVALEVAELQRLLDEADRAIARCQVLTMEARRLLKVGRG